MRTRGIRIVGWGLILFGLSLPAPAVTIVVREFFAADRCLDSGGSYDYARGVCDHERNHPYISFSRRYPHLMSTVMPLTLAGAAIVLAGALVLARTARRAA